MSDLYRTLEIDRSASSSEIKAAYRKLAKKYHPDKNKSEKAEQVFQEINKAYEVLSNPQKRSEYDAGISRLSVHGEFKQRPVPHKRPQEYTKSTIKKGKIFGLILLIIVIVIPISLIRYSSKYNYDKALEFYSQGDLSRALIYFDRAIMEFGSRKQEASFKAINICYEKGYVSQGIVFAQKGTEYISNKIIKGNLSFLEGLGWETLEQFKEADLSYQRAIEYGYNADSVYIHLGTIHGFELDQYEEAIGYFDHLIGSSGLTEYQLQRGILFQKSGKTEESILDLRSYVKNYPENGMGYFFLGISLIESGQELEACSIFEMAANKGLNESEAYLRLYCQD